MMLQHRGEFAKALNHVAEISRTRACWVFRQHHQEMAHGAKGGACADIGGVLFDRSLAFALVRGDHPCQFARSTEPMARPGGHYLFCLCDRRFSQIDHIQILL